VKAVLLALTFPLRTLNEFSIDRDSDRPDPPKSPLERGTLRKKNRSKSPL
jgi:hypothetical protein